MVDPSLGKFWLTSLKEISVTFVKLEQKTKIVICRSNPDLISKQRLWRENVFGLTEQHFAPLKNTKRFELLKCLKRQLAI